MKKRIFSPYRICPIGAHVDHQGGAVLGRTITLGTTLEYEPFDSNEIHITSDQFGEVVFFIDDLDRAHWVRYAQAAARVLNSKRGMKAYVTGSLIGSGLSSSASVGLAYLKALADINGKPLDMHLKAMSQPLYFVVHNRSAMYPSPGLAPRSLAEAIKVCKRPTAGLIKMKPSDVRNTLSNFGVFKRRSTPHTIPREEQFQRHVRVDLVP